MTAWKEISKCCSIDASDDAYTVTAKAYTDICTNCGYVWMSEVWFEKDGKVLGDSSQSYSRGMCPCGEMKWNVVIPPNKDPS
jgi:hypothetical protein